MSTPIIEYISLNIYNAVAAVTKTNGYNYDIVPARANRLDFESITPADLTAIIMQLDEEKPEYEALGSYEWIQPYSIFVIAVNADEAGGSIDTKINKVKADIQKKLMVDATRGGYAVDTILLPCIYFDDGKGFSGICVNIVVHYRVDQDDPYTKA
jgi:hypothetical protein